MGCCRRLDADTCSVAEDDDGDLLTRQADFRGAGGLRTWAWEWIIVRVALLVGLIRWLLATWLCGWA